MLLVAAAQALQKLASPCYFVAVYHCLKVQLVDDDSRPVKKYPMFSEVPRYRSYRHRVCSDAP